MYQGWVKTAKTKLDDNIKCIKESDRHHSALRTSKQREQNKMTDVDNILLFFKENNNKVM